MRVLLDECLPRRLKRLLADHEVVTVPEAGWAGKRATAIYFGSRASGSMSWSPSIATSRPSRAGTMA